MEYPSSESAKVIIQSGIEEVIILGDANNEANEPMEVQAGRILLTMAEVQVRYCKPSLSSLTLDFVSKISPSTGTPGEESQPTEREEARNSPKIDEHEVAKQVLLDEANYDASKIADNGMSNDYLSWQDYL